MSSECPITTEIVFDKIIDILRVKYSNPDYAEDNKVIRMCFAEIVEISKEFFTDIKKLSPEFQETISENLNAPYKFNIDLRICENILKSTKPFKERFLAYELIEDIDYIVLPDLSDGEKKFLKRKIYEDGLPDMQITLMTFNLICARNKSSSSIARAISLEQSLYGIYQNYIRGIYKVKTTGKDAAIADHYAVVKVKEPIEKHTEEFVFLSDTLEKLQKKIINDKYESVLIEITEAKLQNDNNVNDAKVTVKNILKAIEVNFRKQIADQITRELSDNSKNSKTIIKEKTKSSVLPVQVGGSKVIIKDNSYNINEEDLKSFIQIECIDIIESGTPAYIKPEPKSKSTAAKYTSEEVVATSKTLKEITSTLTSKKAAAKPKVVEPKEELQEENEDEEEDEED
jgi:mRNA-degrading endonuclease RelE of RelBE toxin-antitoxin system